MEKQKEKKFFIEIKIAEFQIKYFLGVYQNQS